MLHRPSKSSVNDSELSASRGSSHSKSFGSSDELSQSQSGSLSSPGLDTKQSGSISSARSSVTDSPGFHVASPTEFLLKTLGMLTKLQGLADGPLEVINAIDCAQQEEDLPFTAEGEEVYLSVSAQGIKVTSSNQRDVVRRIPLFMIERLVTYDGGVAGNTILAIKVVVHMLEGDDDYVIYAYQCPNKEVGQKITSGFSHVLSDVISSPRRSEEEVS